MSPLSEDHVRDIGASTGLVYFVGLAPSVLGVFGVLGPSQVNKLFSLLESPAVRGSLVVPGLSRQSF